MTAYSTGDIVLIRPDNSGSENSKPQPVLILAKADSEGDMVVAHITSNINLSLTLPHCLRFDSSDLVDGEMVAPAAVRVDKVATISSAFSHIQSVGKLGAERLAKVLKKWNSHSTRTFSRTFHAANRAGYDPIRVDEERTTRTSSSTPSIPYAGRVFTEDEVDAAVSATLDFWLTLGAEGAAFETELASFLGVKHSLLVNSGSSANLIAVSCLTTHKLPENRRLLSGDEVITCAAGFPTTVSPIIQNGCIPVFIDNDPATGNACVEQLEAAYSPGKTKAVMMAHTLGNPFDLGVVLAFCKKYDLWLIEDNCDALGCTYSMPVEMARTLSLDHLLKTAEAGRHPNVRLERKNISDSGIVLTAPTGAWGDLSTQSFYPPHHLTMGEGGAVNIIRRPSLRTYAESFRDWGRDCWCPSGKDNTCAKRFGWQLGELPAGYDHKYIYSHLGYNLKPLDPQAAIGRVQLKRLPEFIQARKANWETLRRGLANLEDVFEFSLPTHALAWQPPCPGHNDLHGEHILNQSPNPSEKRLSSAYLWDSTSCRTDCSWFGFMIRVKSTAPFTVREFAKFLDTMKIGNRMLFGGNLLRQPAFVQLRKDNPNAFRVVGNSLSNTQSKLGRKESTPQSISNSQLPGADEIMNTAIFLGTYPGLSADQLDFEIRTIQQFVAGYVTVDTENS